MKPLNCPIQSFGGETLQKKYRVYNDLKNEVRDVNIEEVYKLPNLSQVDKAPSNFIEAIINDDLKTGKYGNRVHTRFPPEPNGYLHIGHAKSICLNFGLAKAYNGLCNLRFDDTNPTKEDIEYVKSIMEDVKWLGFDWEDRLYYASDYFEELYQYAIDNRIRQAYVCDLSPEEEGNIEVH